MPGEKIIYPATMTLDGDTRPQKVKLHLTEAGRLRIFGKHNDSVALVASFDSVGYEQTRGRTFRFTLADGSELIGKRMGGGGCSCDPLKNFDPRSYVEEPA